MPVLNEFAVVSLVILVFVLTSVEQGQLCPFLIQSILQFYYDQSFYVSLLF